jgi:simple sugar transport system permease protein
MDYTKGTWANDGAIEALGRLAVALVIFKLEAKARDLGRISVGAQYWLYSTFRD